MSDTELATLSTFAWLIGTTILFIVLSSWSTGSWGLSASISRGLRSWNQAADRRPPTSSPSGESLTPMRTVIREQLWGPEPGADERDLDAAATPPTLEELGERTLR